MRAEVAEIQPDGLVLRLDDGRLAWLPSEEWSTDPADWESAYECVETKEEIDVSILSPEQKRGEMVIVSRCRFTLTGYASNPWLGKSKSVRIAELTRQWFRGFVGVVPVLANQQVYYSYITDKALKDWAKDHAVIGPGDTVRGFVEKTDDREGVPVLDMAEYLRQREEKPEFTVLGQQSSDNTSDETLDPRCTTALTSTEIRQISPVMLVEDDLGCCAAIRTALERQGIDVQVAASPERAHSLLRRSKQSSRFRLAIIDLHLDPDAVQKDGFTIIKDLQGIDCRVVMLTGEEIREEVRIGWGHLLVHSCLQKPFMMDELFDSIRDALTSDHPVPWRDLIPLSLTSTVLPHIRPRERSAEQAVTDLAHKSPGTVVHVFAIHERSKRGRSVVESGSGLNWLPLRGKIAKSVIHDSAFADDPIAESDANLRGTHMWTRKMMVYRSFLGLPVHVPGPYRHALSAII